MLEFKEINIGKDFKKKSFPYYFIDNYLKEEFLNALIKDIKKYDYLIQSGDPSPVFNDKKKIGTLYGLGTLSAGEKIESNFISTLRNESEKWNKIESYFTSKTFFSELVQIFKKEKYFSKKLSNYLFDRKPRLKEGSYKRNIFDIMLYKDFHLSLRFSRYTDNCGTTIHRDNNSKVIALLLYLNDDDWKVYYKGGINMYSNEHDRYLKFPKYSRLTKDLEKKLKIEEYIEYKKNRILLFCNTENAWHGVPPTILEENIFRDSIQVNLFTCNHLSSNLKLIKNIIVFLKKIIKNFIKKN